MASAHSAQPPTQVPYALSLLVCDAVAVEAETGKRSILGCFSSIHASQFPAAHAGISVFVELTDGKGEIPVTFRLVDADDQWTLYQAKGSVSLENPLVIGTLNFKSGPLEFPVPGEYRFQLHVCDELLMERRILLKEAKE